MSKTVKGILLGAAFIGAFLWIVIAGIGGTIVKPYVGDLARAWPIAAVAIWWGTGFLGGIAISCQLNDRGVSRGAALLSFIMAPMTVFVAGLAVFAGPFIGAIVLGEKWFPGSKERKELPPGHWSNKIIFRCPGKA
jgi:hypothetical protein